MQAHNKQLIDTLINLRTQLDQLVLRGLSTSSEAELLLFRQAQTLFSDHGAAYLATRLEDLLTAISTHQNAVIMLFKFQSSLFLFERLLTQSLCIVDGQE